ncbi:MAG: hypothetical protein ACKO96_47985 [Flammeovirgaceae bacterium]
MGKRFNKWPVRSTYAAEQWKANNGKGMRGARGLGTDSPQAA